MRSFAAKGVITMNKKSNSVAILDFCVIISANSSASAVQKASTALEFGSTPGSVIERTRRRCDATLRVALRKYKQEMLMLVEDLVPLYQEEFR
jgi:hypothetical protein